MLINKIKVAMFINKIDKITKSHISPTQVPVVETINFLYTLIGDIKVLLTSLNKEFAEEFQTITNTIIGFINEFEREVKKLEKLSNPSVSAQIRAQARLMLSLADTAELLENMYNKKLNKRLEKWLKVNVEEPYQSRANVVGKAWEAYDKSITPKRRARKAKTQNASVNAGMSSSN